MPNGWQRGKEVLVVRRTDGSFQMAANVARRITKLLPEMRQSRKDLLVDTQHENQVLDPNLRNMTRSSKEADLPTQPPLPAREQEELAIIVVSFSC